jgi:hypothetical protein
VYLGARSYGKHQKSDLWSVAASVNMKGDNIVSPVEKLAKTSRPPRKQRAEVASHPNTPGSSTLCKRSQANKQKTPKNHSIRPPKVPVAPPRAVALPA